MIPLQQTGMGSKDRGRSIAQRRHCRVEQSVHGNGMVMVPFPATESVNELPTDCLSRSVTASALSFRSLCYLHLLRAPLKG